MEVFIVIQIYTPSNTNFDMNGNDVLTPSVCTMEAELGGAWSLNMTHPIDDEGRWKNIVKEAVISAPTFMGKKQLFRIDESEKQDTEIVVKAYPIFFDSADEVFILDKRPTDKTGQEALDILTEGTKYSGTSDITTVNTAYFIRRNLMDCLNGDSPSFIGTWGGEPLYDNFNVIVCERAGANNGAEVRYGKNMNGISFKEDMSQVVTRIVPVAYNGRTLSTNYVDSPLIGNYAKIYTKEIKFEDVKFIEDLSSSEDTDGIIICNSQEELDAVLIAKCNEQFESGIDVFKVTIQIDMIALENTNEYQDFADIVKIGLGDTVSCYNKRLDIVAEARAIKIKWDCITDSVEEVTLGDYETDFLKRWNSTISKVSKVLDNEGNVMAEHIAGILNAMTTQLRYQKTLAQKQDVRAILFEDLDPDSEIYGAMCLGTQGFQIANKRLPDDSDWDWTTAFTANGGYADILVAGVLADKLGKNWWNLNTGEFNSTHGYIGGWNISEQGIFKDVVDPDDDEIIYRVILNPPLKESPSMSVILACQISYNGGRSFEPKFELLSNGSGHFGDVVINADGSAEFADITIDSDGTVRLGKFVIKDYGLSCEEEGTGVTVGYSAIRNYVIVDGEMLETEISEGCLRTSQATMDKAYLKGLDGNLYKPTISKTNHEVRIDYMDDGVFGLYADNEFMGYITPSFG